MHLPARGLTGLLIPGLPNQDPLLTKAPLRAREAKAKVVFATFLPDNRRRADTFPLGLQSRPLTWFRQHNGAKEKREQQFLKRNLSK